MATDDAKLNRAHRHIEEAAALVRKYLSSDPVRLATKVSDCREWDVVYIAAIRDYDPEIPCAIGDSLYNLRSSLDHLMMNVVGKHCDSIRHRPQDIYFPLMRSEMAFSSWTKKDALAKQLPLEVISTLAAMRPFYGGSVELATLHRLNNIDKHRNLLLSAMNYESIQLPSMMDRETNHEIMRMKLGEEHIGDHMLAIMSNLWIRDVNCEKPITVGQEITSYRRDRTANNPIIKFDFSIFEKDVEVKPIVGLLQEIESSVQSVHQALARFV